MILLIIGIIIIFAELRLIYNINSRNNGGVISVKSDLKDYDIIKQQLAILDTDSTISENARYQKLKKYLISLESPTLSKKQKYDNLALAKSNLFDAYISTKNNKLYVFSNKLTDFTKTNFSEYYNVKKDIRLVCFNLDCADSPQPKEILYVVQEINSSNLPSEAKSIDTEILIIYSFTKKDEAIARVKNYYYLANMIKRSSNYEKAELNIKIYNEIIDYLKNNYPDLLKELSPTGK